MPYADRYGITIVKVSDGIYDVSRNDRSGRVRIKQIFSNEALNEAQVLFRAIEHFDPVMTEAQRARFEYAIARWKIGAYEELARAKQAEIEAARPRDRAPLRAERDELIGKYDVWVAREVELRTAGDA